MNFTVDPLEDNTPHENPNTGPSMQEKVLMIFPNLPGFHREVKFYAYDHEKVSVRYEYPDGQLFSVLSVPLKDLSTKRKESIEGLKKLIQPDYDLFMSAIDPDNQT